MRAGSTDGSVLIVTLWASALLVVVAMSMTGRVRLAARAAQLENRALYGRQHAAALARIAVDGWQEDATEDGASARRIEWDTGALATAYDGALPPPEVARLAITVAGESGKANVNRVSVDVLTRLAQAAGVPPGIDVAIAGAIADWRDPDTAGLAEADFYARRGDAYRPADTDIVSLEDLLFVDGVTPGMYFGEDRNHNGLLDPEEDDGPMSAPCDNADGRLQPGLRDLLTVHGEGAINVNLTPPEVLSAVLHELLDPARADQAAQELIALRRGRDGIDGTRDDRPFDSDAAFAGFLTGLLGEDAALRVLHGADWTVDREVERYYLQVLFPESGHTQETTLVVTRRDGVTEVREWREY